MSLDPQPITPDALIAELGIDGLNATADAYFARIGKPLNHMGKPFSMSKDLAANLHGLSLLLEGLSIERGQTVLDFGTGTGWLARCLAQMGCRVYALDVSKAGLRLGERLMREFPPCCEEPGEVAFLHYDSRSLPLEADAIDRILCFDAFHHVANPETILQEFYRILSPGGIVGFREPGLGHSASPESQAEMRKFRVLENDIDKLQLRTLWSIFGPGWFHTLVHTGLGAKLYDDAYDAFVGQAEVQAPVFAGILETNRVSNLFFLGKGAPYADSSPTSRDSTQREGLACQLTLIGQQIETADNKSHLALKVRATNTGTAKWLPFAPLNRGKVLLGCHLWGVDGTKRAHDLQRAPLPADRAVGPGESANFTLRLTLPAEPELLLELDLVAEAVGWFSALGSEALRVAVAAKARPDEE